MAFIASRNSNVAMFQTNSPESAAKVAESFAPSLEKPISGGAPEKALKKLYARQINLAGAAHCRNPADRARRDQSLERVVGQEFPVARSWLVEHSSPITA